MLRRWLLVGAVLTAAACSTDSASPSTTGETTGGTTGGTTAPSTTTADDWLPGHVSGAYSEPGAWLCLPGTPDDPCETTDLSSTVIDRSGDTTVERPTADAEAPVDCFYVHPTVDRRNDGSVIDLGSAPGPELDFVRAEAARLSTLCRVYAPRYPAAPVSLETDPSVSDESYARVLDAFDHYDAQLGDGRPVVLVGHGQGADLLTRLAQDRFDDEDESTPRGRLVAAYLLGARSLTVEPGTDIGGSFTRLPLCRDRDQLGCIIAFNAYDAGAPPSSAAFFLQDRAPGAETACTNPAGLGGGRGQLRGATFPTEVTAEPAPTLPGLPPVDTPFVTYPDFYLAECVSQGAGITFLRIDTTIDPLDVRGLPRVTSDDPSLAGYGAHLIEMELALGDLLAVLERQVAALG